VKSRDLFRPVLLILTFGLGAVLAGCATSKSKTSQAAATTSDDEYVTVTETGSRVSRRVKKSELSALKSPDLTTVSGVGFGTAGGDGGNAPSAGSKGR